MEEKPKDSSHYCRFFTKWSIIIVSSSFILIIIPLLLGLSVSTVNPVKKI